MLEQSNKSYSKCKQREKHSEGKYNSTGSNWWNDTASEEEKKQSPGTIEPTQWEFVLQIINQTKC